MSFLIKLSLFSFASGSTDAWITFWGSYMGALIGAGIVYLVTTLQIKEQRSIQIEAIREEHKNALNREMKQYHFRNQIDKIEEFYEVLDELTDSIMKCSNEFTKYLTFSEILYGGRDKPSEEQEIKFKGIIREYRGNLYDWIHNLTILEFKMRRLSLYIEDTDSYVKEIARYLNGFVNELKSAYGDKNSFKVYFNSTESYNQRFQSNNLDSLINTLSLLSHNVLERELNKKINEMRSNR